MNSSGDPTRSAVGVAELVQQSQLGDQRALESLLSRFDHEVLNMAYRLLGNRDDALDIRQTVCLKVCRSIEKFDGRSMFHTWLFRIVVNQCRDHVRRRNANHRRADGWHDQAAARTDLEKVSETCFADEQSQRIAKAVSALPAAQREVLVLRHYHDMTLTAAAELLEIPLSTAASRLGSAMKRLRDELAERESCGCQDEGVRHAL